MVINWRLCAGVCLSGLTGRLMNISCQGRVDDISIDTWDCGDMYLHVCVCLLTDGALMNFH